MISLVTDRGVGFGPVLAPSPASCNRTFIMSMGWMTVVATMPATPPLMKGRAPRMSGVCRKSVFAATGSFLAVSAMRFVVSIASEVLLRAASAACLMEFEVDILMEREGGEVEW